LAKCPAEFRERVLHARWHFGIDCARHQAVAFHPVDERHRGRSADEYRQQFDALLKRAIGFAGGISQRVVVVSIPDWGVTPYAAGRDRAAIASEIERFNTIGRQETARAGARWVDITPISRRAASEPALIAADGLHPSAAMYGEWVKLIAPVAAEALRAR